jgi:phosphate starvation-inducible PhoH-like protein
MRGRAQPLDSKVLTPAGWRPIGDLEAGDLVVGSDGLPTPVLGVYPQGRKDVYRVRTQDGASTRCCGEHLWTVTTRDDRGRGKPARVLETREMIGNLRAAHDHRYELPLVQPVEFEPQPVPMDPHALGLLLGDGCLTASRRPALAGRGGRAVDLVSRQAVPAEYLRNSAAIRLAALQGVLDAGGEPGAGGTIQFVADSAQLRDAVLFLTRSLGGVATWDPAFDAHVMDIRLPEGVQPFRLARKRDLYDASGGGRPMRFIDSIEPEGEAEMVCIQVAAADSLYVTDDLLVTHNTLNDSFIVLDEAQNTTPEQMKMFLTRLGFNSKAVVTGDVTQVDLPSGQMSGLKIVRDILTGIEGLSFSYLSSRDVVRHRIVQDIVEAYRRFDEARA